MSNESENGQGADQPSPEDVYEVGNKKPPRHSQFRPGQSGNPKGRPRGSVNLKTLVEQELGKLVTVSKGGKTVKMRKRNVLAARVVDDALKGDSKAMVLITKITAETPGEASAAAPIERSIAVDRDTLLRVSQRMRVLAERE